MAIEIDLYGIDVAVVVAWPSGIVYSNQANGVACDHFSQEGILIPAALYFAADGTRYDRDLTAHFQKRAFNRGALEVEDADALDTILASADTLFAVCVDRSKLGESFEAWVHVIIDRRADPRPYDPPPSLPYPCTGVLVWENSD